MQRALKFAFCLALTVQVAMAGQIIDGIVAKVNKTAILLSDWDEAIRYEAFVDGKPLNKLTDEDHKATLDRLIDQELLRQQLINGIHVRAERVDAKIAEIRKLYPGAETEAGWKATLQRYGLTEAQLKEHLKVQIAVLRMVDERLRPGVQVDSHSVETYYREKFLPELRQKGAQDVPLASVAPKIQEVLAQERVDELLTAWLRNLRAQSEIQMGTPAGRQAAAEAR
jgi:peptidyl-prolyl cis-trans isomerase SurA